MAEIEKNIKFNQVFKVNQRLDVMLSKTYAEQFSSRIEEIESTNMMIAMPMNKGIPIILRSGNKFYGRVHSTEAIYFFESSFIEKRMNPIPVWVVSQPVDIEKIQQRSFVRVDASIPVKVEIPPQNEGELPQVMDVTTRDISGGGLMLVSKQPLEMSSQIVVTLTIPEVGLIQTVAEVMRVYRPQMDRNLYWLGIKYVDMHEQIRSKIIRFVFQKQMEQRKKGI